MAFDVYTKKARGGGKPKDGLSVTIGKKGSMYLSHQLVALFGLKKGQTVELAFDKVTHQIRLMFLGAASSNTAMYLNFAKGEKTCGIHSESFFTHFRLSLPADVMALEPKIDGKVVTIKYPDLLCPKA